MRDEERLKLLEIFHYVVAGIAALFSFLPVFHLIFGIGILVAGTGEKEGGVAFTFMGVAMVVMAGIFICLGLALAGGLFVAGRSLAERKRHFFCLVMAGVQCVFVPFGTVLGIFTIIILMRESVKALFLEEPSSGSAH